MMITNYYKLKSKLHHNQKHFRGVKISANSSFEDNLKILLEVDYKIVVLTE
jgi:hypothetical protein